MKKWIELQFVIGDFIYLKTDPEQYKRIVTGVYLRPTGILYEVSCGTENSCHFDFEMSEQPEYDVTKTI